MSRTVSRDGRDSPGRTLGPAASMLCDATELRSKRDQGGPPERQGSADDDHWLRVYVDIVCSIIERERQQSDRSPAA